MDERNFDEFDINIETRFKEGNVYCAKLLNTVYRAKLLNTVYRAKLLNTVYRAKLLNELSYSVLITT